MTIVHVSQNSFTKQFHKTVSLTVSPSNTFLPFPSTLPNGMTGLHYLARSASSSGDPHLDERLIDLVVAAGGDVNAVDAQTRAGKKNDLVEHLFHPVSSCFILFRHTD